MVKLILYIIQINYELDQLYISMSRNNKINKSCKGHRYIFIIEVYIVQVVYSKYNTYCI